MLFMKFLMHQDTILKLILIFLDIFQCEYLKTDNIYVHVVYTYVFMYKHKKEKTK